MLQNFAETDQDRRLNAAHDQLVDELFEVELAMGFFVGMDKKIAIFPNGEIAFAPTGDIVEFIGVRNGPTLRGFKRDSRIGKLQGRISGYLSKNHAVFADGVFH